MLPLRPQDVPDTSTNVDELIREVSYRPQISIEQGMQRLTAWHKNYDELNGVAHNVR